MLWLRITTNKGLNFEPTESKKTVSAAWLSWSGVKTASYADIYTELV
ncbi:hypothetical protein NIES19_17950 [Anabaena cylindrica PCC 7122]|nr:hypothetical protein NIES19_17950 [Anabaena cylindrica PCC 7122]